DRRPLRRMIANGGFPFPSEEVVTEEAPRVGDGVLLLDAAARVEYPSPNAISALHRMGIHGNAEGARLGELGLDEGPVKATFATGLPLSEEDERSATTLLVRCIPLLHHGNVTGAVGILRAV